MALYSFLKPDCPVIREYTSIVATMNEVEENINWYVQNGVRTSVKTDRRYRNLVRKLAELEAAELDARAAVREYERAQLTGLRRWIYNRFVR